MTARTRIAGVTTILIASMAAAPSLHAQRQMESLGRGVVAVRASTTEAAVGWRLLGIDPIDVAFNLYRSTGGAPATKLNASPLTGITQFTDGTADFALPNTYTVRPVVNGAELAASAAFTLPASAPVRQYFPVPLQPPAGGTTPDAVSYTYRANDASVGDLDGDGEYEIVLKWDPTNSKDNSQSGHTGNVYLDGLRLDGTRLWRIDLGRNIRAGAHYTQFMVYDLDGDGRAEIACKTAPGTIDGQGNHVVLGTDDPAADYRNSGGYILSGPEYLTIFDGLTGAALATTAYVPSRHPTVAEPTTSQIRDIWGDNYGNRMDRFLACVAYLDGERPSLVMCRGYYTGQSGLPGRTFLAAWNWRGGQLTPVWTFDTWNNPAHDGYRGQGNHNLAVADVDADGKDEIVYGSCVINDDGAGLYTTGLGHGDALHVSDLDPDRPGLEVWACHEDVGNNGGIGLSLRDARTGAVIFTVSNTTDTGRGVAIDIDPRYRGYEMWGTVADTGVYSVTGAQVSASRPSPVNHAVWWDGDLLREIFDGSNNDGGSTNAPYVDKWDWATGSRTRLLSADGCFVNNFTKANPCLTADLFGDWREEIVLRSADSSELRIYTTTLPTSHRLPTLMHDPQYRLAVAWQNVAYNQPPHPGFFLGDGMAGAPTPDIVPAGVAAPEPSRLVNLSVRTHAGIASETLILGFVIEGTGEQQMLVRGVGPALLPWGVTDAIADPRLDLYQRLGDGSNIWRTGNDDWSASPDAAAITATAGAVGAFGLPAEGSSDAALLATLPAGLYTSHVSAARGDTGIALAEIYAAATTGSTRLVNASARAHVGTGDNLLIAGFYISGNQSKTLLVRAAGPALSDWGVAGVLANPRLEIFKRLPDGSSVRLAGNDDWDDGSGASTPTFTRTGAFGFATASNDAALLIRLSPGGYTAHASGVADTTGVALIEIYDLDP